MTKQRPLVSLETFDDHKLLTSPRSLEACRIEGIDPSELIQRSISSFKSRDLTSEQVAILYDHFENRRRAKIDLLLEVRRRLSEQKATESFRSHPTSPHHAPAGSSVDAAALEKMKQRQRAEILQMIQTEVNTARMEAQQRERTQRQQHREAVEARARRKQRLEYEENKHRMELERKHADDLREKQARQVSLYKFEQEQRRRNEEHEKAAEAARQAAERERQRAEKRERRQLQLAEAHRRHQAELAAKQESMDEKERVREQQMMAQRMAKIEAHRHQAEEHQQRIMQARAVQMQQRLDQRRLYERKEQISQEKRQQLEEQRKAERQAGLRRSRAKQEEINRALLRSKQLEQRRLDEMRARQKAADTRLQQKRHEKQRLEMSKRMAEQQAEERRRDVLQRMEKETQQRTISLINKQREKQSTVEMLTEQRKREQALKAMEARLQKLDRLENVERMRRMEEYKRELQRKRIEEKDQLCLERQNERERLIAERRRSSVLSLQQRKQLNEALERMRITKKLVLPKDLRESLGLGDLSVDLSAVTTGASRPATARSHSSCSSKQRSSSALRGTRPSSPRPVRSQSAPRRRGRPANANPTRPSIDLPSPSGTPKRTTRNASRAPLPPSAASEASPSFLPSPSAITVSPGVEAPSEEKADFELPHDTRERLEEMRRAQSIKLLAVLTEEQNHENERESLLLRTGTHHERRRLEKIFSIERAKAHERIIRLTAQFERELVGKMNELGITQP